MGLSLKPDHLRRYRDIASLLLKYRRSDLVYSAGLATDEQEPESEGSGPSGEDLAGDLEKMGPTFVKVGQLLSSRADLLPPDALRALSRLQDDVEAFPYEDVERIVTRSSASACPRRSPASTRRRSPPPRSGRCIAPRCVTAAKWPSKSSAPTSASRSSRTWRRWKRSAEFLDITLKPAAASA